MKYCFGVDIGGTTIKIGFFERQEREILLLDKWEIKTDKSENGRYILRDIAAEVVKKIKEKEITDKELETCGIKTGIGVPGPVVLQSIVNGCVNLGWQEIDVREEFNKELKALLGDKILTETVVENDANVAALGEMQYSGTWSDGFKSLVMLTIGTGVGGGVVLDGKILSGTHGAAGEIGHMPVLYDETEVCGCGKRGCLEQIASATGIVRHAKRILAVSGNKSILTDNPSAKEVFDAFVLKDSVAETVVNDVCRYLAVALAGITCVIDPEIILIGGGVSKAGKVLIDTITKYYKEKAFGRCRDIPIELAKLGNDAGIYGAAGLV